MEELIEIQTDIFSAEEASAANSYNSSTSSTTSRFTSWYTKNSKPISITVGILIAILFACSISFITNIDRLIDFYDEAGFLHALRTIPYMVPSFLCLAILPFPAFVYMTRRAPERRQIPILIVAFIIACCIVGSQSIIITHTFKSIVINPLNTLCTLTSLIAITWFIFLILRPIFYAVVKKQAFDESCEGSSSACPVFNKPVIIILVYVALIIAWMPYLVVYAPGNLNYDMREQLSQFVGDNPWSNHHPVVSSLIYGTVFSLGQALGGDNIGLFFLIAFQTVALAATLTFEVIVIERLGAPRWLVLTTIGFFMLYALFPCIADQGVKDSLFAAIFTLYFSLFVLYLKDSGEFSHSVPWMLALSITAVFCGLLRNNGFYIVLLTLPFLVFFQRGVVSRLKALIPFAICIVLIPVISSVAILALGVQQGSIREALSVPFMQSARVVIEHSDEIPEEELMVIDNTFSLGNLEKRYEANCSDLVKIYFNDDCSLSEYFEVWTSHGLRYPLTYLDAWGELTYGYWSLQIAPDYDGEALYNRQKSNTAVGSEAYFDLNFWSDYDLRQNFSQLVDYLMHIPFFGFLVQGGIYTWTILILGALLIFAKRPKYLIVLLPCAILMLTIIFGPKNGLTRYFFGETCVFPLLIWSAIVLAQNKLVPHVSHK